MKKEMGVIMIESLLLTLAVGIFFLIGIIIPKFIKNQNKLIITATGLTFIIMLFIIFFDLIPEIIELLNPFKNIKYLFLIIIFVAIGITSLKLLDFFVPEHTHNHVDNEENIKEHNDHYFHIGIITAISLIIHNILEGISIYITGTNDFEAGLLMAITVGLHNLPLGIEVGASMNGSQNKKVTKIIISSLLVVSSTLGATILYLLQVDLSALLEGILLSLTLGMIIYISVFELLHEVKENVQKSEMKIGLLLGMIIAIIMVLV